MVVEGTDRFWLTGTDPGFSTSIETNFANTESQNERQFVFGWQYVAKAGIHKNETRRLFIRSVESVKAALDQWFDLATPEIPAGPSWLHEIALQDYDYFSKNGQGWYADLDAASDMIAQEDRYKAIFTLHNWYDRVGTYSVDPETKKLKTAWQNFPFIDHPELLKRNVTGFPTEGVPSPATHVFRNLENYRRLDVTWEDLRTRLTYARERGFRTGFYLLTGMQMAGDPHEHIADGTGLELINAGWVGPDSIDPRYIANPLHPDVRAYLLDYTRQILDKVGDLVDMLVIDEAYYIPYGTLGPAACPGYADRGQMTLFRDVAKVCHEFRPDLALLTADVLGPSWMENICFSYSLYADGIYQDSWCWPQTWDCVRFPTWRNVAWSCNWAPVINMQFTRYGVLAHNAAVAISNGCFGDDIGLSEMTDDMRAQYYELWNMRKSRTRASSFAITDVE